MQYKLALKGDPTNKVALKGLAAAEAAERGPAPDQGGAQAALGQALADPNLVAKLSANPATAEAMADAGIAQKVRDLQANPALLEDQTWLMSDPRMLTVLMALMGLDATAAQAGTAGQREAEERARGEREAAQRKAKKEAEEQRKADDEAARIAARTPEQVAAEAKRTASEAVKAEGNALYSKRDFAGAIAKFGEALTLDGSNIAVMTNRAAARSAAGDHEGCIRDCEEAVSKGREIHADFKLVGRAYERMGAAYGRMERWAEAVESYDLSLAEHREHRVVMARNEALKKRRLHEAKSYEECVPCRALS